MAEEVVKIIKIETGGSEQTVKGLKEEINNLRDALLNTEKGSEEYKNILNQLIEDQKRLTDVMRAGVKEATAAEGSYNALVNQMAALKKVWRETTDEASRDKLGKQINSINKQLKEYDASIGNYSRNVGNYTQSVTAAFGSMGGAAKGMIGPLNGVKSAFTAISAHPIVAVLTALAALLVNGIAKGFKNSEEASNKMSVAFSALQGIADHVAKAFEKVALWIANLTEKAVTLLSKLGMLSPELKKSMEDRKKIAQDQIKLDDKQRDNIKKNADLEKEVAELRAQAADKTKYTAQERLKFLEEAELKEQEIAQNEIDALQLEYDIAKAKLDISKDNAELKQQEAEAYAKLTAAQTAYAQKVANSRKAISRTRKEMETDARNATMAILNLEKDLMQQEYDLQADGSKKQLELAKQLREKELQIEQEGFKEKIKNRKDYERAIKMSVEKYNNDIAELERQQVVRQREEQEKRNQISLAMEVEGTSDWFKKRKEQLKKQYDELAAEAAKLNEEVNAKVREGMERMEAEGAVKSTVGSYTDLAKAVVDKMKEYNDVLNSYYDALDKEVEDRNQVILASTKPMSKYYRTQIDMLYKFYKENIEGHKRIGESDAEYALRKSEAWKAFLEANKNMNAALMSELDLRNRIEGKYTYLYGDMVDQLEMQFRNYKEKYQFALIDLRNAIIMDLDGISEAITNYWGNISPDYVMYNGLVPTPEVIRAIILQDKEALMEMLPELTELTEEKLNSEMNLMFDHLLQDVATQGLIDESLITSYLDNLQGMVDTEADILKESVNNWVERAQSIGNLVGSVADAYEAELKYQVKTKQKSEAVAKQEFEDVKKLRIAEVIINTLAGATAAFMGWQDKGQPWGAIIGAVQAAATLASGWAQLRQIQMTEFGSSSNGGGSIQMAQVTPMVADYNPQMTGNLTGEQETEALVNAITEKPIRAYVVESDITSAQQTAAQRNAESTF